MQTCTSVRGRAGPTSSSVEVRSTSVLTYCRRQRVEIISERALIFGFVIRHQIFEIDS